jgi:hypothetical protein
LSGAMATAANGVSTGRLAAFRTAGYPGEPPLLEELGVRSSFAVVIAVMRGC